jgi:hypothetical protein
MEELISRNSTQWELGNDSAINDMVVIEEFSEAGGKNAGCHFKCNFKRKKKRGACFRACDVKHPPTTKQREKRDDASKRTQARKDKKEDKKDCKSAYKSGQIGKSGFRDCKKDARKEKRAKVKEAGGNLLVRYARGMAKVFPLTLAGRGGAITLIKKNAFGFATRIAPALVSEQEAKSKFSPEGISGAKAGWKKLAKAWRNLGGNPDKLKKAILSGYNKKPMKIGGKKSKFDGDNSSNISGAELAPLIIAGVGTLTSLIAVIAGVAKKDPYKKGETPPEYEDAKRSGDLNPPPADPNTPVIDPTSGEWIDPNTGREIDPLTGQFKDTILGMNKWLVIGLGVAVIGGATLLIATKKK